MSVLHFSAWRRQASLPLAFLLLSACSAPAQTGPSAAGPASQVTEPQSVGVPVSQTYASGSVSDRLTVWLSLVGSSHASAQDYADFLKTRPVWPRWQLLQTRMQQALSKETDPAVLARLCTQTLTYGPALAQCASQGGSATSGLAGHLAAEAKQAWMNGNDSAVAASALSGTFPQVLTPEASWLRFNREEKAGSLAAARQTLPYLSASRQKQAQARLAFRANDPGADALAASLPASEADDPYLILDHLRWLRTQKRDAEAAALWKTTGVQAEAKARHPAFWRERDALARELLQDGQNDDALSLANDTLTTGTNRLDAQFLSGWIALQKMHNPAQADVFFRPLADSASLISKSRGFYWLGRARHAAQDDVSAQADWQKAAGYPGTFYGQMAAAQLAGNEATLLAPEHIPPSVTKVLVTEREPSASASRLAGSDLVQAAQLLVSWGDKPHARDFLTLLSQQLVSVSDKLALCDLAIKLGLPDVSVAVSRQLGRDGLFLLHSGWPAPYASPASGLPSGLVLGLARQESNFNPDAISSSNAIGLMQLKPSTAGDMVHRAGVSASAATASGLHDPNNNLALGSAYLSYLQDKFGSVVPYMAAAYNGGPGRLSRWLATSGDPGRSGASQDEMIDWIESIPFSETRNYVQRVWENMTIYAAMGK
ncbi:lytic transglycosylase domain-containing protein [Acetobacter persici]|uniref:lytic transglycosylase domain-containing protein n=1 Tax=Acetobacter persici TaxID=1076596 RepID=UPI001BA78E06|nr:lytic transglycosylase domain-containing protein [Acetobacter persici]MBS1014564.1 lytic transglycosylase domain-containing protein [Acetobacter persici]